jgi:signal transduction histidine kinase
MWDLLVDLFGNRLWEPHGHCFLWTPSLLWTMVGANVLIALAYYSIPLTLLALVRQRQDLVHRHVFLLFALFIFGCGTTHLIRVWTLWTPVYWLQGAVDAWTAVVSVLTAVVLWPLLPQILKLPSPAQLQAANHSLHVQIQAQQQTEAILQQRTAELESANRALAVANQELEAFTYTASHDLRAPLRAINHLATWITEDAADVLSESSQAHLAKLRARIKRLEVLLNDLLDYARASRQRYTPAEVDTQALVEDVVHLLQPPPGFVVRIAEPLPTLYTERVPLETVLRNLLANAIKHHHDPAQGWVELSVLEQETVTEFTVTDNGPGIDASFHERIFGVFQTLRPQDEETGSGMGLTIVKRLVEQRGGTITVESLPGKGSTFRFTWPKIPPS